jgi:rhodanese-related sulfurtransferase
MWTKTQHKKARSFVIGLGAKLGVTGRGRCAAEGLNCTCTGSPDAIRKFCLGLRAWNPLFEETDFKLTDGLQSKERFKALTVRKTDELVAYGLAGENAPSLRENSTKHLEALDYHKMMEEKDTVIIDVRNAYESAIGHFQPPPGGATLIDPRMRNSHEFPKWLNAPETQAKLTGKKVMMYCTGGIRCERASALLDAMARSSDGKFEVKDTVMVRGGIERSTSVFNNGDPEAEVRGVPHRRLDTAVAHHTRHDEMRDLEVAQKLLSGARVENRTCRFAQHNFVGSARQPRVARSRAGRAQRHRYAALAVINAHISTVQRSPFHNYMTYLRR